MAERGVDTPGRLQQSLATAAEAGQPVACLAVGGRVQGVFVFQERLRGEASAALRSLRDAGLSLAILTGDESSRAAAIGRELNVELTAGMLPEDKLAAIADLQRRHGPVAMVGDGVNDAPALAAADVGIAMGCGADVVRQSADVCLLGNDLSRLPWTIGLAQRTVRTIRQNLFWAFAYNIAGIALAAAGVLNPIFAAIAMVVSSVLVVTNSLRLSNIPSSSPAAPQIDEPIRFAHVPPES
jgi:P-type E1-E2 ATPase